MNVPVVLDGQTKTCSFLMYGYISVGQDTINAPAPFCDGGYCSS